MYDNVSLIPADVAQMILDNCSVCDPHYENLSDNDCTLIYNYEFMEDTGTDS